jgi:hypothetical protein
VPDAFKSAIGNLAIQNQGFDDYLRIVDDSGVYRISDRQRQALAALQASGRPGTEAPRARVLGPGASRAPLGRPAQPGMPAQPARPARAARPKQPSSPPDS